MDFDIYPAIDLRHGRVVRLRQGDPGQQKEYSAEPGAIARRWLECGARWLHVVNLDGAFGEQDSQNYGALQSILAVVGQFGAQIQFGGGLRSLAAIQKALEMGVTRVVLGTVVIEQPQILLQALERFGPEQVAAGLDAQEGRLKTRGWVESTPLLAIEQAVRLQEAGLRWLIFTDIARDGLETGVNLEATRALAQAAGLQVIASGGVKSEEEVRLCRQAGLAGVILGRALYEGNIDLKALLEE